MGNPVAAGAVCWILTAEFVAAQIAAQLAWPAYVLAESDISLLGASACGVGNAAAAWACSPLHLVFNAGLAAAGLLIATGAWWTRAAWPRGGLAKAGLWLVGTGGGGAALAGVFAFDTGPRLHGAGAALYFFHGNLGLVVLGMTICRRAWRLGLYSMVSGLLGLGGAVAYLGGAEFLPRGILERLAAYPQTLWFVILGVAIMAGGRLAPAQPT